MAFDLTSYDENLMENTFFQTLLKEFNEVFLKAISEDCIICVPRIDSLSRYPLTLEDFLTHILVPTDELPESHFHNLCGAEIKIGNGVINVDHEAGHQTSVHILFQETFYTKDCFKYVVLCVDQPFNLSQRRGGVIVLKNLRDCLDLLWTETGSHETIEIIDRLVSNFLKKNTEACSLVDLKDLVNSLYLKCIQTLMCNVRKKYKTQKHAVNNLKIAVETYMQHGIYKHIMKGISTCTAHEDAQLNKIVRNYSDLHYKDFNIETEFYSGIPKARSELARINGYSTTLGKIGCLRRTVAALSNPKSNCVLSADDLLQILAFLIIKTNLPNWNAQLKFLKLFQFSNLSSFDENNFLITSLEAAITFVQTRIFCQLNGESEEENLKNSEVQSLKQVGEKASMKEKAVNEFFHLIALGDLDKVKKTIEASPEPEDFSFLCHPLCTCEKCYLKMKNDGRPSVKCSDDQGLTPLHIASMCGVPSLVEYFLALKADPNASDCDGRTPVHYASLRGHQKALFLLIHNNADINALDNLSNSPLHLGANNGHENCVKALIYFSEHLGIKLKINQKNIKGDTPLHHAAKWGFMGIVKILLEYGADSSLLNKRKFSPIDYAHNTKVCQLLKQYSSHPTGKIRALNPVFDLCDHSSDKSKSHIFKGIKPSSTESMKQVDKVFRAIEKGDFNLVCFRLNVDPSEFGSERKIALSAEEVNEDKCHPLCVCAKCGHPESESAEKPEGRRAARRKGLNINVCNSEGYTPLHVAAQHGHLDLVRGFIRNGALLNAQTTKLFTPLMLACQSQKLEVAKELLSSGCKIDLQDFRMNTALHYACFTGNTKLVEILLKYEPNITLKNMENKTVLSIAREKVSLGIIQVLKGGKPFDFNEL